MPLVLAMKCLMEAELLCGTLPLTAELWYAVGKAVYMYADEACAGQCGSTISQ